MPSFCRGGAGGGLQLRALLCAVFEAEAGPVIRCSDPPCAVGNHRFKPLGRYLLPETFVKGRVVSIVLDDNVILGAPVYIQDTQYDRNCFQFNICVVISSRIDPEPYKDLAQHLSSSFLALEVERKLLSTSEKDVRQVQEILLQLRGQLNAAQQCFVRVDDSHCIAFHVRSRSPLLTPCPSLADVPVPLVDLPKRLLQRTVQTPGGSEQEFPFELDLTLLRLAPFIDGARTVEEVISASRLQMQHVLLCLRHLQHFGYIAVIAAIHDQSRYLLTPEFHVAFEQPEVLQEVVRYVTAGQRSEAELVDIVQSLYARIDGLQHPLWEFKETHSPEMQEHGISLRHFITFGLLHGFLEVIDDYNQDLSEGELIELEGLRAEIRRLKQELQASGLTKEEVNKDQEIKQRVMRLNQLKAKERGPAAEPQEAI